MQEPKRFCQLHPLAQLAIRRGPAATGSTKASFPAGFRTAINLARERREINGPSKFEKRDRTATATVVRRESKRHVRYQFVSYQHPWNKKDQKKEDSECCCLLLMQGCASLASTPALSCLPIPAPPIWARPPIKAGLEKFPPSMRTDYYYGGLVYVWAWRRYFARTSKQHHGFPFPNKNQGESRASECKRQPPIGRGASPGSAFFLFRS